MIYIRNTQGDIIGRSKNLRGIRRHASRYGIELIRIHKRHNGAGFLKVYFCGCSAIVRFVSFQVLAQFIRQWHNARGVPLNVNGLASGVVTSKNPKIVAAIS